MAGVDNNSVGVVVYVAVHDRLGLQRRCESAYGQSGTTPAGRSGSRSRPGFPTAAPGRARCQEWAAASRAPDMFRWPLFPGDHQRKSTTANFKVVEFPAATLMATRRAWWARGQVFQLHQLGGSYLGICAGSLMPIRRLAGRAGLIPIRWAFVRGRTSVQSATSFQRPAIR